MDEDPDFRRCDSAQLTFNDESTFHSVLANVTRYEQVLRRWKKRFFCILDKFYAFNVLLFLEQFTTKYCELFFIGNI